jgi:hypothetical protein
VKAKRVVSIEDLLKQSDISGNEGQQNSVTNTVSKGIHLKDSGNKTEAQPAQPIKQANLEILLSNISVNSKQGATVIPSRCPAVARAQDYGKTDTGDAACVFHGKNCPYFDEAGFVLEDYYKIIKCNFKKE